MKSGIIILTILLCGLTQNFQSDSKKETKYILKGKLINGFDGLTPLCGISAWATVLEFEIIEFSDSEYIDKTIPIIFTCPNSKSNKQFKVGKTYELILTDKNPSKFEWTMLESKREILNQYELNKEYWFVENKNSR
ncbi:hypothetical protein M0G43_10140 [Subsaxibacter sp. CAU 1640]|uniref:hypothetical protein n=1 Tax=Subsaxibacter sp. CAU 1640 TaxID=2933271 RepID=UPI0020068FF9|nr:hypothetical protein [Subsaxibacter sp. CAU 1640]MCK7590931.1 hypothetical protein [Subsaxibacter sp. CAU 1640]